MLRSRRPMAIVLVLPFLVAACGGAQATSPPASTTPAPSGGPVTKFVSPKDGATVTGNSLDVQIAFSGFRLSCAQAGKPVVAASLRHRRRPAGMGALGRSPWDGANGA